MSQRGSEPRHQLRGVCLGASGDSGAVALHHDAHPGAAPRSPGPSWPGGRPRSPARPRAAPRPFRPRRLQPPPLASQHPRRSRGSVPQPHRHLGEEREPLLVERDARAPERLRHGTRGVRQHRELRGHRLEQLRRRSPRARSSRRGPSRCGRPPRSPRVLTRAEQRHPARARSLRRQGLPRVPGPPPPTMTSRASVRMRSTSRWSARRSSSRVSRVTGPTLTRVNASEARGGPERGVHSLRGEPLGLDEERDASGPRRTRRGRAPPRSEPGQPMPSDDVRRHSRQARPRGEQRHAPAACPGSAAGREGPGTLPPAGTGGVEQPGREAAAERVVEQDPDHPGCTRSAFSG